jgi:hypothetical protein
MVLLTAGKKTKPRFFQQTDALWETESIKKEKYFDTFPIVVERYFHGFSRFKSDY